MSRAGEWREDPPCPCVRWTTMDLTFPRRRAARPDDTVLHFPLKRLGEAAFSKKCPDEEKNNNGTVSESRNRSRGDGEGGGPPLVTGLEFRAMPLLSCFSGLGKTSARLNSSVHIKCRGL